MAGLGGVVCISADVVHLCRCGLQAELLQMFSLTSGIEISTVKPIVLLGTCIVVVCVTTLEQFLHQTRQAWTPVLLGPVALF